jgi:hypothetical protein
MGPNSSPVLDFAVWTVASGGSSTATTAGGLNFFACLLPYKLFHSTSLMPKISGMSDDAVRDLVKFLSKQVYKPGFVHTPIEKKTALPLIEQEGKRPSTAIQLSLSETKEPKEVPSEEIRLGLRKPIEIELESKSKPDTEITEVETPKELGVLRSMLQSGWSLVRTSAPPTAKTSTLDH